ncbi:hypothetical protein HO133_009977 [Letharia lupina]|uniref:NOT2/NOT3/NOT5 C-terminal domain-containing protein n=1 Tax=Letharia lupina TaxID=560253 RepID=A0A8H6CJU3_9LECA|nr:uncharacterized protein HO133_009977 [Letharia lupina]KAF6224783.1 hypothetical protein HO133_009977 [Letharia lupina]
MPGYSVDEGYPSPKKKIGSARTSKKSKRRNAIRYVEWSGEQESVKSSPTEVQQQAQDVAGEDEASPEFAGEGMIPVAFENALETPTSLDHQMTDASPDDPATAPQTPSPPEDQHEDAAPPQLHSPTTSEHTEEIYEIQRAQEEQKADEWPSENMRPNAQNLRYGGYPAQPAPQNRNTPLGSGRLQNTTKLGNGTNWGFGAPANGAPGLPSVQPSQTGVATSSFAQRVGGSQPAAPLDLSEFPSLSGTSQPQYQNTSQAIWANQRVAQQTPVQRPQQSHPVSSQAQQQHQPNQQSQDQSQRGNDDMYSASSNLQNSLDDHRYGGQSGIGQMPVSRQPQPTSVDDFPPLGRNGTDESDSDRRNLMQNAGFGGFSNANTFSLPQDQIQTRHGLPSASSSQANNTRSSSMVERLTSPNGVGFGASSTGRSPIESNRQGQAGMQDHDRNIISTTQGNTRNEHALNALLTSFNDSQFPPQRQTSQPQQPPQGRQDYGARTGDSSRSNHTPDRTPLSQMSAIDEFGLPGFLSTISNDHPEVSYLARGQDLTTLGLNLNSAEPLYPTFAGPFADPGSRPMQPDFRLPECYTVDNIHHVREKIPHFSDETLFWIFYTQPRDIIQEFAATELTNRNWRFHTDLKMWLTKDITLPEPIQMSVEKEQGSYVFFNQMAWEKVRVSNFELQYKQLAPSLSRPNGP